MEKNIVREKYKLIRKNIINKKEKSSQICDRIILTRFYQNSTNIGLYYPLSNEVDVTELLNRVIEDKKDLYLPKIIDGQRMVFMKVDSLDELIENKRFKVMEPTGTKTLGNLDVIFIPGICFDKNKNRVGFGKGYYDLYLKDKSSIKIGICFDECILDEKIDTRVEDVKMDYIISEKVIF